MRIGLIGKAGAGKSTIAKYLVENDGFIELAFADQIKDAVRAATSFIDWVDFGKEEVHPAIGKSFRQLCQTLGSEWGQEKAHPDLWIMNLLHRMETLLENPRYQDRFVVSDCRFVSEAQALRSRGFILIRVQNDQPFRDLGDDAAHISENQMDAIKPDYTIWNVGDLNSLYSQVEVQLKLLRYKEER